MSFACSQIQQYDVALDWAEFALKLAESSGPSARAYYYCIRGRALLGLGQLDRALEDLSQAVTLNAYVPESFSLRAEILDKLGKHDAAEADHARAAELACE